MKSRAKKATEFFEMAMKYCMANDTYLKEIEHVRGRVFRLVSAYDLLTEYIWVVMNSGMRNQVAEKIFYRYMIRKDLNVIRHKQKREAIDKAQRVYAWWYSELRDRPTDKEKIKFLETLPFIGPITKYHLARNIGLDCAKPDRHLIRLAARFKYDDVQLMCQDISELTGERIGVVDVVLWRYCNMHPGIFKEGDDCERQKDKRRN